MNSFLEREYIDFCEVFNGKTEKESAMPSFLKLCFQRLILVNKNNFSTVITSTAHLWSIYARPMS